MIHLQNLVTKK